MDLIESIIETSENSIDVSKKYLLTSYKYSKLKLFYLLTYSLSTFIKVTLLGGFISLGLIFSAIAGAIYLGEYFDNTSIGYLAVGLIMIIIGLITLFFRKMIDKKIIKKISKHFF